MIYVDKLFAVGGEEYHGKDAGQAARVGAKHGHRWCHMWTDGPIQELHAFAAQIGMRRAWFQDHSWLPHYDLVPTRRAHALRLGAVEKSLMEYRKELLAKAGCDNGTPTEADRAWDDTPLDREDRNIG